MDSDINVLIEQAFTTLLSEEEDYAAKGSGYSLESIDGLLLSVYKYTPIGNIPNIQLPTVNFDSHNDKEDDNNNNLNQQNNINNPQNFNEQNDYCTDGFNAVAGSSYIQLPPHINNKRATINPQNNDNYCFKWAVLAKHVTGSNKHRVGENYYRHENKYNFSELAFPTPWSEVNIFEKNNPSVSVNIYGVKKTSQPSLKHSNYHIFPLKIVDNEKADHFDLILITDNEKNHYVYISNFSRLIRSQTTLHGHSVYYCKRCFTSFDDRSLKYKLSGQLAL